MLEENYVATEEFNHDVAWLKKNSKACQLAADKAYKASGRGALFVNITAQSISGRAYPFHYFTQKEIQKNLDGVVKQAVKEYDSAKQFVLVLSKPERQAVAYTLFRKRRLDTGKTKSRS